MFEDGVSEMIERNTFYSTLMSPVGGNDAMVLKEQSQPFQTNKIVSERFIIVLSVEVTGLLLEAGVYQADRMIRIRTTHWAWFRLGFLISIWVTHTYITRSKKN